MKGKPYSDAEIRPESGEVTRFLKRHQYDSSEWSRDAGIKDKQRGLDNREVETDANVYQIDTLPTSDKGKI